LGEIKGRRETAGEIFDEIEKFKSSGNNKTIDFIQEFGEYLEELKSKYLPAGKGVSESSTIAKSGKKLPPETGKGEKK